MSHSANVRSAYNVARRTTGGRAPLTPPGTAAGRRPLSPHRAHEAAHAQRVWGHLLPRRRSLAPHPHGWCGGRGGEEGGGEGGEGVDVDHRRRFKHPHQPRRAPHRHKLLARGDRQRPSRLHSHPAVHGTVGPERAQVAIGGHGVGVVPIRAHTADHVHEHCRPELLLLRRIPEAARTPRHPRRPRSPQLKRVFPIVEIERPQTNATVAARHKVVPVLVVRHGVDLEEGNEEGRKNKPILVLLWSPFRRGIHVWHGVDLCRHASSKEGAVRRQAYTVW